MTLYINGRTIQTYGASRMVQGEHRAEPVTFRMTMPEASELAWYLGYERADGKGNATVPLETSHEGNDTLLTWYPTRTATNVVGKLAIIVYGIRGDISETEEDEEKRWSTLPAFLQINKGLEVVRAEEIDPDVMEAWLAKFQALYAKTIEDAQKTIDDASEGKIKDVEDARDSALSSIASGKSEALDAIAQSASGYSDAISAEKSAALSALGGKKAELSGELTSEAMTHSQGLDAHAATLKAEIRTEAENALASEAESQKRNVAAEGTRQIGLVEASGASVVASAKADVDSYVEGTTKPSVASYASSQVDSAVETNAKPRIDAYASSKETTLSTYAEGLKTALNSHEKAKEAELDTYTATKKTEISSFTETKKSEITSHTTTKLGEITQAKDDAIDAVNALVGTLPSDFSELTSALNETQKELATQTTINETQKREIANLTAFSNGKLYNEVPKSGSEIAITGDGAMVAPYAEIKEIRGKTRKSKNLITGTDTFDGFFNLSLWALQTEKYMGLDVRRRDDAWVGCSKDTYLPVGTYTFSVFTKTIGSTASIVLGGAEGLPHFSESATLSRGDFVFFATNSWTRQSVTFNVTSAGYVYPRVELWQSGECYVAGYQLEEGSEATPYEPYFEGLKNAKLREVVSVGKNLLDSSHPLRTTFDGVQSNKWYRWDDAFVIEYGKDYTFSCTSSLGSIFLFQYVLYDESWHELSREGKQYQSLTGITFKNTTQSNARYCKVGLYHNSEINAYAFTDVQLEESSVATDYVPYREPQTITLPSLVLKKGDVYDPSTGAITEEYGKVDLGTLIWTVANGTTSLFRCSYSGIKAPQSANHIMDAICSKYDVKSYAFANNQTTVCIAYNGNASDGGFEIYDPSHSSAPTSSDNWLSGVEVLYALAEPTTREVTPISPFIGVEDGSKVSIVSDDAQAEMDIRYMTQKGGTV